MPVLVDLTQEIYVGMPVFPGHLKTVMWEHASHNETARNFDGGFSYRSWGLLMSDHGPTHVDAISHFDPRDGAPTIDAMPLTAFYGPGTCIDVSHVPPRCDITPTDLDSAAQRAGDVLARGDALLLHTGAAARCGGTPEYAHDYSGLSADAAEWLAERGVRLFGVDAPSPDNPASPTYPVHMMCRRTGITHYENLANLDRVIGTRFTFIGFPLRIRGGTGSPVRAVAVLDDPPPGEPVR